MTILVIGALLWAAMRRWRSRPVRRSQERRRCLPDVADLLIAALRAGYTPARAMILLSVAAPETVRPTFAAVATGLDRGERFTTLLGHAAQHLGPDYRPLCDVLIAGERLGIPTETMVLQLSADARLVQRLLLESEARRLPVRLGLPLVCCTLPAFVALVIVPVIAGTLTQLHING